MPLSTGLISTLFEKGFSKSSLGVHYIIKLVRKHTDIGLYMEPLRVPQNILHFLKGSFSETYKYKSHDSFTGSDRRTLSNGYLWVCSN